METYQDEYHEKNRNKVCVVCYRKGQRSLSQKEADAIEEHLIQGYKKSNQDFPCAICEGCHLLLSRKIASKNVCFPVIESYDSNRPKSLRSVGACNCKICQVATSNGLASLSESRKRKANRGRPKTYEDTVGITPSSYKICSTCFAKIFKGFNHKCSNSRRDKIENIEQLITSPKSAEVFASRVLKKNEMGTLQTLGPNKLKVNQSTVKKELFSTDDISVMQKDLQLSTRQTFALAQDIRAASGSRKCIESEMKMKIMHKNHELDDFFEHRMLDYKVLNKETKSEETISQHTIVCSNLASLVDKIIEKRKLNNSAMIRIGLDGGGGFIKLVLSVFELNSIDKVKRTFSLATKFKDSGVKKAFIAAIVPEITENYFNMKKIWINVGMHLFNRKFTIATDLKLCNILLGLMSHSSMHPCCWCDIDKHNLDAKGKL